MIHQMNYYAHMEKNLQYGCIFREIRQNSSKQVMYQYDPVFFFKFILYTGRQRKKYLGAYLPNTWNSEFYFVFLSLWLLHYLSISICVYNIYS